MRRFYHDALVVTSVVVSDLDDGEASPDFNYHRKSLLKINANHGDDFQGD